MNTINWGVLGTASIANGCTIPGMLEATNCVPYAIAGRKEEKVKAFQEKFGFKKAYLSYEELLADPDIEAVYIPLPNHLHYEWCMKAIEAGKHVLCEKPLAPTAKEAEELFEAARKKGVFLMEAFAYLHSPYVAALKDELKNLGDIVYIESAFLGGTPSMEDYRMHREYYGGSMYDLGCYSTSMILSLVDQEPVKVQGLAEYTPEGIDIFSTAYVQFDGGTRAHFTCSMVFDTNQYRRHDRLYVHGTKGIIKSAVEFNQAGELKYNVWKDGVETTKTVNALQNYRLEVEQLGRCITEGEKPHVSAEFSIKNAKLIDMILKEINY